MDKYQMQGMCQVNKVRESAGVRARVKERLAGGQVKLVLTAST